MASVYKRNDSITIGSPRMGAATFVATREVAGDAYVQADRTAAREDYLLQYAWRIGDVMVRDLADRAPISYIRCLVP